MLKYRVASEKDSEFLFHLRNLKTNRIFFKNTEEVAWDEHIQWLTKYLSEQENRIYIFSFENKDIGQFRVDRSGDVGISLLEEYKGRGFGTEIIRIGTSAYLSEFKDANLTAVIKKENVMSMNAFEKAGFLYSRDFEEKNQCYKEYKLGDVYHAK